MKVQIEINQGLAAHFTQPDGPSIPGMDWFITINTDTRTKVIIRTYAEDGSDVSEQNDTLSQKAVDFIMAKLNSGWKPKPNEFIIVPKGPVKSEEKSFWKGLIKTLRL